MITAPDEHDWLQVTAPNGDRGYQCQRCRLTAISLPVPPECRCCPLPGWSTDAA
jgi:hypothetical protein